MIKHRFVGRKEPREREVDDRCQGELSNMGQSGKISRFECQLSVIVGIQGNGVLTPRRYARSNRRVPTPTCIFVFMLLMGPGINGGTETIIAAAARQFCERHEGMQQFTLGKGLQFHMYTDTFHVVDTSREHQHECGAQANTKRQSQNQIQNPF